jgi:hypothetical protein
MIENSGRGRKKTVRKKVCRRKAKNTEEGDKYLLCGEEDGRSNRQFYPGRLHTVSGRR